MSRRYWLILAIVVVAGMLTTAALLMRDAEVGSDGDGDARQVSPSSGETSTESTEGAGGGTSSAEEESETVISDAPADSGDSVPDGIAYELIDALRRAEIEPVMGEALTLEYMERLNRVRVSGRFESTEATSFVLEFNEGIWRVER